MIIITTGYNDSLSQIVSVSTECCNRLDGISVPEEEVLIVTLMCYVLGTISTSGSSVPTTNAETTVSTAPSLRLTTSNFQPTSSEFKLFDSSSRIDNMTFRRYSLICCSDELENQSFHITISTVHNSRKHHRLFDHVQRDGCCEYHDNTWVRNNH